MLMEEKTNADRLGYMKMPENFKYRSVLLKGRPEHNGLDDFSAKHPPMPVSKWAKIFSPFDALRGFGDEIRQKEKSSEDD